MTRPCNVASKRPGGMPNDQATDLCVILGGMADDDLAEIRAATRALRRAVAAEEQKRTHLHALVVAARTAGIPQKDIAEATGFTRETIRRIVDDAKKRAAQAEAS
jgi:hypothetical protein